MSIARQYLPFKCLCALSNIGPREKAVSKVFGLMDNLHTFTLYINITVYIVKYRNGKLKAQISIHKQKILA